MSDGARRDRDTKFHTVFSTKFHIIREIHEGNREGWVSGQLFQRDNPALQRSRGGFGAVFHVQFLEDVAGV
jgi:hypothetical protein